MILPFVLFPDDSNCFCSEGDLKTLLDNIENEMVKRKMFK